MDSIQGAFDALSLDNILADSVNFVNWIKRNVTGAEDSKTIIHAGSWGGSLTTFARLRYPDVYYGMFPSSACLNSFRGLPNNTQKHNWWNWVQLFAIPASTTQANPQADLLFLRGYILRSVNQDSHRGAKSLQLCFLRHVPLLSFKELCYVDHRRRLPTTP